MRDRPVLVLIADGQRAQIDTAACWSALIDAIGQEAEVAGSNVDSCTGDSTLDHDAAAAERAARRALRTRRSRHAAHRAVSDARAAKVVQRWLAQLPGGPAAHEADIADTILRALSSRRRAGADIRIERLLRRASSPEDAVRQLADLSLGIVSAGPHAGGRPPGRDRPVPPPELIGILLLRGTAR